VELLIFLIVLALPIFYGVMLYNRMVALRLTRQQAVHDIDVQLKLRYDLIPNLLETVKGYAAHESGLFEKVTAARSSAMNAQGTAARGQAEAGLSAALMNLYAVAENYPDLKANDNFAALQRDLGDIENKIAASRRFLNNATQEYNTYIQQFPAVLIAQKMGFKDEAFWDVGAEEKARIDQAPTVKF
jgi:LemA protein